MPYFLNPVDEDACIFLNCEGVVPDKEARAIREEVCALLAKRPWHRIVVDFTAIESSSKPSGLLGLGMTLLQEMPKNARVALIVQRDQAARARLLGKVARSSAVLLRVFFDVDRAEAWVRNDAPMRSRSRSLTPVPSLSATLAVPATNGTGSRYA